MMNYCPQCRSEQVRFDGRKFSCPECRWVYFHNVAAAAMALLTFEGKLLFTVRAREPALGLLDFPGGFVDPGESAEEALGRELKEELGLWGLQFKYLGSAPNIYPFKGITYHTCDLIFTAELEALPSRWEPEEIGDVHLYAPDMVDEAALAFASVRAAIALFRARRL